MIGLFLTLSLTLSQPARADSQHLPEPGEIYSADVPLSLYSGTPDPSFGTKAPQIGRIQEDENLQILETRQYPSALGTEIWVEVEKAGDPNVHGWIFLGSAGQRSKLQPVRVHEAERPSESETILRQIDQEN